MKKMQIYSWFSNIRKKAIVFFSKNVSIDQRTFEYPEEIIRGMQDWAQLDDSFGDKYFTNDLTSGFINSIQKSILRDEASFIQVLGLAGLGKTRLIYECFNQLQGFREEVFYCNAASQEGEIQRYLLKLIKEKKRGVLIVDNCNSSLAEVLYSEFPKNEGLLNLITIDKEVGIRHGSHKKLEQFVLKPQHFENDLIPDMIKHYYPQLPSADVEKIATFSQGFPMIAKLLADGLDLGLENIGELTDDALLRKLVGVEEMDDEDAYHVLRACSIFDKLGYTHDLRMQKEFVANNSAISRLTSGDNITLFENKCSRFLKRGIIEKHGRYISVRPKPLAIRLAADWWRECVGRGDAFEIIQQVTEQGLGEDLCNQIAKLDFLVEAQQLTEELCGPQAPFGKAEVLNTSEGSRLFRSLAEVNPIIATETLFYHYGNADIDYLRTIRQGRRYLVWALEKLCFRQETFEKAAKVLLNFAVAENEDISNNATGQFVGLYQLILPGTSANLEQRYKVLEHALSLENHAYSIIALSAISRSLAPVKGSSRMMGAENFGSSPKLVDHTPVKDEVEIYYESIIQILKDQICNNKTLAKESKEIIGKSIRGIFENGFGSLAIKAVEDVLNCQDQFWREAFVSIIQLYDYSKGRMSSDMSTEVLAVINKLKPRDLRSQYDIVVKSPVGWDIYTLKSYRQFRAEGLNYAEIRRTIVKELINNNIDQIDDWNVEIFFEEGQQYGVLFGDELASLLITREDATYSLFLNRLVQFSIARYGEVQDVSVLAGYLGRSKDKIKQTEVLEKLLDIEIPLNHYLNIARYCEPAAEEIVNWINFFVEKNVDLSPFHIFSYGRVLDYMPLSDIIIIVERIAEEGANSIYVALDILSSYVSIGEASWLEAKDTIKKLISSEGFISNIDRLGVMIMLDVKGYIAELLKENDLAFIECVKNEVLNHITDTKRLSYHSEVEYLLEVLIRDHFLLVWKDLGRLLLNDHHFYLIARFHLGVREGSMYTEGILFSNKENLPKLFEWCRENSPRAPQLIASIMPTGSLNQENGLDWHPFAILLINEFGDDDLLLSNIQANIGSYSSVGSSVPYLKSKLYLLNKIKDHPMGRVKKWAKEYADELKREIEKEELRDEEWGIR